MVDHKTVLEVLVKQKYQKRFRDQEYKFIYTFNVVYAPEQLKKHTDIDIVLSDINMHEMDGLTLLTKLSEQHPLLKSLIILRKTSYNN